MRLGAHRVEFGAFAYTTEADGCGEGAYMKLIPGIVPHVTLDILLNVVRGDDTISSNPRFDRAWASGVAELKEYFARTQKLSVQTLGVCIRGAVGEQAANSAWKHVSLPLKTSQLLKKVRSQGAPSLSNNQEPSGLEAKSEILSGVEDGFSSSCKRWPALKDTDTWQGLNYKPGEMVKLEVFSLNARASQIHLPAKNARATRSVGSVEHLMVSTARTSVYEMLFFLADSDGTGSVNFEEAHHVLAFMQPALPDEQREEVLRYCDKHPRSETDGILNLSEFMELCVETMNDINTVDLERTMQEYSHSLKVITERHSARMRHLADQIDRTCRLVVPLTYVSAIFILFNLTFSDRYSSENGRAPDVFDVEMQQLIPKAYVTTPNIIQISCVVAVTFGAFVTLGIASEGMLLHQKKERLAGRTLRNKMDKIAGKAGSVATRPTPVNSEQIEGDARANSVTLSSSSGSNSSRLTSISRLHQTFGMRVGTRRWKEKVFGVGAGTDMHEQPSKTPFCCNRSEALAMRLRSLRWRKRAYGQGQHADIEVSASGLPT
uniref:Calmodulin n=1 Tax=Coccolithus braarudii TaxID=221442 RepID=A0A7S0Q4E7_9EUKA|mmetsp:Transcript_4098/g.8855  ORF Transcript_4098/g.8855 Transcript_4098/m.8855 type:complete len:548 (+) Transcript_4098:1-1644(+)